MSVFSKKFEALLAQSPMFRAMTDHANSMADYLNKMSDYCQVLEKRVTTLESQMNILASTTRSLMETHTQLMRGHAYNRKAIEELYNYVTGDGSESDEMVPVESDVEEVQETNAEIEAYKKTLN